MNLSYNSGVRRESGNSRNQDLNVPATTLTSIHRSSSMSTSSPEFSAAVNALTLETEPGTRYKPTSSKPVVNTVGSGRYYLFVQYHKAVSQQPMESLALPV